MVAGTLFQIIFSTRTETDLKYVLLLSRTINEIIKKKRLKICKLKQRHRHSKEGEFQSDPCTPNLCLTRASDERPPLLPHLVGALACSKVKFFFWAQVLTRVNQM